MAKSYQILYSGAIHFSLVYHHNIIFSTSLKLDRFTTKKNSKSNPKVVKPVGP